MTIKPRFFCARSRAGLVPAVCCAAALAAVMVATEALGCPNCKDAVNTADPEGLNVARGYFYSILLMLAMPCTLLGSFGIYVWRETHRLSRAEDAARVQSVDKSLAQYLEPHEP
jgi:hypothetical protein